MSILISARSGSVGDFGSDDESQVSYRIGECLFWSSSSARSSSVVDYHCNKKWAKRSFPLENNRSKEGKFPCGYWNIYPATHTVFIHSSVWEKCSRLWTGKFYRSKKGNFLELSFLTDISGKFLHSLFLKDISRKIPAFPQEECSRHLPPPWLILKKLTLWNRRLGHFKCWH